MTPRALRVLLVANDPDDHALMRDLLADATEAVDELVSVRSCAQGLDALSTSSYDIILLDYDLGPETALHFLRRLPDDQNTPVILLSGEIVSAADLRAIMAGAADHIVKGEVTPTLLQRSIRYAVDNRRAQDAKREAELRYRVLLESAGVIVWQASPDTFEFTLVSPEAEAILGYPVNAWTEDPTFWENHIHPEDREWVVDFCRQSSLRNEPHVFEYRMITVDGRVVWLRDIVRVIDFGGRRQLVGVMVDITEQKEAEQTLRLQQRALATISEGIMITDPREPDGPLIYTNPAFEKLTGYTADEVIGKNCRLLQGPDTDPAVVNAIRTAVSAGESFSGDILNYRKDGSPFWNHLSITPLRDEAGTLTHFVGVLRDITERKRLIEALRTERTQLGSVFHQAPAFMATSRGPEHVFELANPHYLDLVGERDLVGRRVRDALPEVVDQGLVERLDEVYATGEPFVANQLPVTLQRTPGSPPEERILNFVYQPLREADGSVSGVLAHGVDVTEQARMQERLRVAEAHYRRLVESAPQAIYALDTRGRFIELNPAGEQLLQRPAVEMLGQHFSGVIASRNLKAAMEGFDRFIAGQEHSTEFEQWIVRPSGEERLLLVIETAIREGDTIVGAHGIARDITEERARDGRMRVLTAALDGLPEGVNITTLEGEVLYSNAAHARILGHEPGLDRLDPHQFIPDEDARAELIHLVRALPDGGSWSGRIECRRLDDGRIVPLDAIISRVGGEDESLIFTILKDATERIAREQHLRRAERLASVGTLLGGVAHELNNPLHAIRNFAELMLMEARSADDLEALEIMKREADRAARVVSSLRTVARQTQEEGMLRDAVDLNEVVRHVLRLREYALKTSNIEVREDLTRDLPSVWADRSQLEQVVLNIVVNAEQAMSVQGEGLLILRTRPNRAGVSLSIIDTGPGIARGDLDRIFDPFFTTKAPGDGTGLGLSLVHSIVAEHAGDLRVESKVGEGAAFSINLPRSAAVARSHREVVAAGPPVRALRILVVDDEPALRRSLDRFLTRRGHAVDVASEGAEAIRLLDAAGDDGYDAILSDLKMPGLNGEQFLAELRERRTGLEKRLVFLTGDPAGGRAANLPATGDIPILLKPISLDAVADALEQRAGLRT